MSTINLNLQCVQYIDGEILSQMVQSLVDLLRSSSSMASRVATANFLILLNHHLTIDQFQPHVGKLFVVMLNGLSDRNRTIRRTFATCIGQLIRVAKDSSVDKLVEKLKTIYLEKEDMNIRSAIGLCIHSMAQHHQEKVKARAETIVPLVFFAMHTSNENKLDDLKDSNVWEEVWHEVASGGTESTLMKHIDGVCEFVQNALLSASWPVRAQAAKAIKTVAEKIGDSLEEDKRDNILEVLVGGLQGRIWDGKEQLLSALATFCKNVSSLKNTEKVDVIVEAVLKECKKKNLVYRKSAIIAVGNIVESLEVDRFNDIYTLVDEILTKDSEIENSEDREDNSKTQEAVIALQKAAFTTLGKAWPKSENVQVLYREKVIIQCVACLQSNTRVVQVSIMAAVIDYLEKLTLLNKQILTESELAELTVILSHVIQALTYALSIPKHTQLRKEALNVFLLLVKKLQGNLCKEELQKLNKVFSENFEELNRDNSPEVKMRVIDIKEFFSTIT